MSEKKTGQQIFEAWKIALEHASPELQARYAHIPRRWEDLNNEQRKQFEAMAWRDRLIIGEFEKECH